LAVETLRNPVKGWLERVLPKYSVALDRPFLVQVVMPIIGGALIALVTAVMFWLIDKYIV
jgi:hypothetical protein